MQPGEVIGHLNLRWQRPAKRAYREEFKAIEGRVRTAAQRKVKVNTEI
jgi:hypothetical protein